MQAHRSGDSQAAVWPQIIDPSNHDPPFTLDADGFLVVQDQVIAVDEVGDLFEPPREFRRLNYMSAASMTGLL